MAIDCAMILRGREREEEKKRKRREKTMDKYREKQFTASNISRIQFAERLKKDKVLKTMKIKLQFSVEQKPKPNKIPHRK